MLLIRPSRGCVTAPHWPSIAVGCSPMVSTIAYDCDEVSVVSTGTDSGNYEVVMAGATWSKGRKSRHAAKYPPGEKAERGREALKKWREVHADQISAARAVTNILVRRNIDTAELADALSRTLDVREMRSYCRKLVTARIGKVAYRGGALRLHFST